MFIFHIITFTTPFGGTFGGCESNKKGYQRGIISTDILGDRLLSYFHICFTKEHDVETNDVSA